MHILISDLHLVDHSSPVPASDHELVTLINDWRRKYDGQKLSLVFLGDVVDLLVSDQWNVAAESNYFPWNAASPNFRHFEKSPADDVAVHILETIVGRYQGFAAALADWVNIGNVSIVYVPGNHDDMVRHSTRLRDRITSFLSLTDKPAEFDRTYINRESSIYALHGHEYDPVNFHRRAEGHWAFGDAIVLRVVNRFVADTCHALGIKRAGTLGEALSGLECVASREVPIYVHWLTEEHLANRAERKVVEKCWDQVVTEFLSSAIFRDPVVYGGPEIDHVRKALSLSKGTTPAKLLDYVSDFLPEDDYSHHAEALARAVPNYRIFVFGHTHLPTMKPLYNGKGGQFYVNLGCWRRTLTRPVSSRAGPYCARRLLSYLEVNGDDCSLLMRWTAD